MFTLSDQLPSDPSGGAPTLNRVVVPDLWQQEAVTALREGADVVVHAPTGAGKTLVFELWSNQGRSRGQAVYTVPTRALANDKLAEWRARGWNVGIATGDLSDNLDAPVVVATLETQKHRLIRGEGPDLLVIDEYQMLGDPDRGLNYELAMALAPSRTQLLLLSGSVANPGEVVKWFQRLGRKAVLVRYDHRPVPLDEVLGNSLSYHVPSEIRGYWPRLVAKALAEDLGPILIFAPRRAAAESLAAELARYLPVPNPLQLSVPQRQAVGEHLTRLLKSRIAYHHSGLSYAARAGVVEPLAKAGQLRVVVATMGLAAGINFSLRSVALAGESYRRDQLEQPLRSDEILQMFGRAGRRGIDETGFVLVSANEIRLRDAHPSGLTRNGMVDWGALLSIMHGAVQAGLDPFREAVRTQARLFSSKPIVLGVEESIRHPDVPCGLRTDSERARRVRSRVRQMLNSRGEWQDSPKPGDHPLATVFIAGRPKSLPSGATPPVPDTAEGALIPEESQEPVVSPVRLRPALTDAMALEKVGTGTLVVLEHTEAGPVFGRSMLVAELLPDGRVEMVKWVRRRVGWAFREVKAEVWSASVEPALRERLAEDGFPVVRFEQLTRRIVARVSLDRQLVRAFVDAHGVPLWRPRDREVPHPSCMACDQAAVCRQLSPATGTAMVWRRLGLIDAAGVPTRRGRLVGFFHQGDGLAIAAALEDARYPLEELVYDLANLDAGFRFCGDENRWAGRLALACHACYGNQSFPGYLENGVPPRYGSGAEAVVAAVHREPQAKVAWITPVLGAGDIDRMIIEWRSRLRQVSHAPAMDWGRWTAFQERAKAILNETESPTLTELPPLEFNQTRRLDHRLILRRH